MGGIFQSVGDPLAVAVEYLLGSPASVMVVAEALQVQQGNQNHNPDNSILGPAEIQSHSESLLMPIRKSWNSWCFLQLASYAFEVEGLAALVEPG